MTNIYNTMWTSIIERICSEKRIFLGTELFNELMKRINEINDYVNIANNSLNHNLNSTQVISTIVYNFLREKEIIQ